VSCLATTLLKVEESAQHKSTFCPVTLPNIHRFYFFTETLSNKRFLICLLTTLPHLKYVATLPCSVSSFACFLPLMFHKVVWQHMLGAVRFLIIVLLQIY